MDFSINRTQNNIWYGTFERFTTLGVRHGIATRLNGVSSPPYHSLNFGLRVGDDVNNVITNRQRFCKALGIDFSRVVTSGQVHGDNVAIVTKNDLDKGLHMCGIAETDALITATPNIPLMVFFADCVPLLFLDPVRSVVGACHAGWRGSTAGIASKVVLAMSKHFGTAPSDCLVGVGPSIGQCCYEVDEMVISSLRKTFTWWEETVIPQGAKWKLDLWELNRRQLVDIGVKSSNIIMSNVCTACNTPLFFSYRAELGDTGVLAAVITL